MNTKSRIPKNPNDVLSLESKDYILVFGFNACSTNTIELFERIEKKSTNYPIPDTLAKGLPLVSFWSTCHQFGTATAWCVPFIRLQSVLERALQSTTKPVDYRQ